MAERVCPVWVGYFMACPVRKWFQNPQKILAPYVKPGMRVLDVGCAMGFFSLPLARMIGPDGMAICVDMQEKMIRSLAKRARKAGLSNVETRVCSQNSLCLDDVIAEIDFALAFAVVHEVPDIGTFFSEVHKTMKQGGRFLVAEPGGHVSKERFEISISVAEQNGFRFIGNPHLRRYHTALLARSEDI